MLNNKYAKLGAVTAKLIGIKAVRAITFTILLMKKINIPIDPPIIKTIPNFPLRGKLIEQDSAINTRDI
jgi:hypothetical protein